MHAEHPVFTPPDSPEATIWRYLDLSRFLSLLVTRSLYFCRADLLGDPFEGTISKATVESYKDSRSPTSLAGFQDTLRRYRESLRRNVAISCWHIAERESTGMWVQYAGIGSGIAICSTYTRLLASMSTWPTPTYVGCVSYVDYDGATFGSNQLLTPFVHKRQEFASERELRAVISQLPASDQSGVSGLDYTVSMPVGTLVPIDLAELVKRVVLAPNTPDWQVETIRDVTASLGYSFPIERSRLDGEAILG